MVVLKLFPKRKVSNMKLFTLSTILGWGGRHFNQENHSIRTMPRGELNYIINFQTQSAIFHQKSCFAKIKPLMFTLGNTSRPSLPSSPTPCTWVCVYTHPPQSLFLSRILIVLLTPVILHRWFCTEYRKMSPKKELHQVEFCLLSLKMF